MHILTIKWNKRNAVAIILFAALLLIALIVGVSRGHAEPDPAIGIELHTTERRVAYLASLGWTAVAESESVQNIVIPKAFNEVYSKYNALQKEQGFDLSDYCGMDAELYTYTVTNHPSGAEVSAQLILFSGQVIGGDIHSTALEGFMHGIVPSKQ